MELFESPELTLLDIRLLGWMKSEVQEGEVDAPDELFAGTLDGAVRIWKSENQLRPKTRNLRARVTVLLTVGFFDHLLRSVSELSFTCNRFFI